MAVLSGSSGGAPFAHALAPELDAVRVVQNAVEDRVGQGWVADDVVPRSIGTWLVMISDLAL